MKARIFAPDDIVAVKARAIQALGAELIKVSGPRSAVTQLAVAAGREAYDVGHARDDAFLEGTKTIAYELFEELGERLTDVVTPVGQGTVLIGLAMGFADLVSAGRMERAPRLHGVQAEACAPLVRGATIGRPSPVVPQPSIADGIRIPEPTRAERSYAAVRYSGGRWIAVSEHAIEAAWRQAAAVGLLMEPTSAAAIAGARVLHLPPGAVLIITGSGMKAIERY
jgi:threonine synthase